jgi:hypothetical protein
VDFWGEGWVLRVEDCGGLDMGMLGETACGAARGRWVGEGVCVVVCFHGGGDCGGIEGGWTVVADLEVGIEEKRR